MNRRDKDRLIESLFLVDTKALQSKTLTEFYNGTSDILTEFLNPEKAYDYSATEVGGGYLYQVEKQGKDPQFVITLKPSGKAHVLDFYWPETDKGFEKVVGLEGSHYLDTVSKVLVSEVLPLLRSSEVDAVVFTPYSVDNAGALREKVFRKMISKFLPNDLAVEDISNIFIIKRK